MTIDERIAKLEHQNRTWRRVALGSALTIGALLVWSNGLIGPAVHSLSTVAQAAEEDAAEEGRVYEKVRLRSLEIVNEQGETVVDISGGFGGGALTIWSDDRNGSLSLYALSADEPVLWVKSEEGTVELTDRVINVIPADHRKRARKSELIEKLGNGQNLTEDERRWFQNESVEDPAVTIGFGKQGGGVIDVCNPLDEKVVSIQSNKNNDGAVYVNDVNGDFGNALVPR